ncbi:MAG: hypothetical protein Q4A66_09905 [Eubacteriales bacterium]|nr:hypothetical protein [Eubacteriales bacterium]
MAVRRIDGYEDARFPEEALRQHGAFEADGEPVWIGIVSERAAVVHGKCSGELLEEFRFFAEHICEFYAEDGALLARFPQEELFDVQIRDIQPSQFYVDEEKLRAVLSFVRSGKDVAVPLIERDGRYVSLDGHTRLCAALRLGEETVRGFLAQADWDIEDFVREAQRRGVRSPGDMPVLSHEEYCEKWHGYCDEYFARQ